MKTLESLSPEDHRPGYMTASEYELVECAMTMSGRVAVRNAVIRNGEGYVQQIRELPIRIPVTAPAPEPPYTTLPDLRRLGALAIVAWLIFALIVIPVVKGAGIERVL